MKLAYKVLIVVVCILVITAMVFGVDRLCRYLYNQKSHRDLLRQMDRLNQVTQAMPKRNKIDYPIFYINLDKTRDRRALMEDQFRRHRVQNYRRIAAIDGRKLDSLRSGSAPGIPRYINSFRGLTSPELGCTLSHLKAIKIAYTEGLDTVLILEDDASIDLMPLWDTERLSDLVKNLHDWEIIQFGHNFCDTNKDKACWGTWAYLINRAGAKKILDQFYPRDVVELKGASTGRADDLLYKNMKTIVHPTSLFFQRPGPSSISWSYEGKMSADTAKTLRDILI